MVQRLSCTFYILTLTFIIYAGYISSDCHMLQQHLCCD